LIADLEFREWLSIALCACVIAGMLLYMVLS
jgi:hypothetical protein